MVEPYADSELGWILPGQLLKRAFVIRVTAAEEDKLHIARQHLGQRANKNADALLVSHSANRGKQRDICPLRKPHLLLQIELVQHLALETRGRVRVLEVWIVGRVPLLVINPVRIPISESLLWRKTPSSEEPKGSVVISRAYRGLTVVS